MDQPWAVALAAVAAIAVVGLRVVFRTRMRRAAHDPNLPVSVRLGWIVAALIVIAAGVLAKVTGSPWWLLLVPLAGAVAWYVSRSNQPLSSDADR